MATKRVTTYKRITDAISEGDVKRVDAVVRVAIRQNASPEEILDRLCRAANNVYAAKGFTSREKDFVLLLKRLGAGSNSVYALSKMFSLPSMTTVRSSRSVHLKLSISAITPIDIAHNFTTFVIPRLLKPKSESRTGSSIMWDGFHVTPKAQKSGNEVSGMCREHAPEHDLALRDLGTLQKLACAVHESKTCHYAKEATVFLLGPLRGHHYSAIPFIVSGSCLAERAPQLAQTIEIMMDLYEVHIKPFLGPLFMTCTDGAAVYRAAQHFILTSTMPAHGSPLHTMLFYLPGFNISCGKYDVVFGPDPKHIIKSKYSLIRLLIIFLIAFYSRSGKFTLIRGRDAHNSYSDYTYHPAAMARKVSLAHAKDG